MLDWNDLHMFLAVARHGTLSAAARTLKVTQPTMGRRIAAFERRLGARLFERSARGWTLSAVGQSVLQYAETMEREALAAEIVATGRDAGVEGQVRITASEWVLRSVLGPLLGLHVARYPGLRLELIAEPRHMSLVRREADIALRPSRFTQQAIAQRAVAMVEFGLYAADSYLAQYGAPDFARGCSGHVLVGMSDELSRVIDHDWLRRIAPDARVAVRCNGREPMVTLAAAGAGMACLPRFLGDATAGLRLLAAPQPGPSRQLWLGVHSDARKTPRIRVTVAFIVDSLQRLRAALHPSAACAEGTWGR